MISRDRAVIDANITVRRASQHDRADPWQGLRDKDAVTDDQQVQLVGGLPYGRGRDRGLGGQRYEYSPLVIASAKGPRRDR